MTFKVVIIFVQFNDRWGIRAGRLSVRYYIELKQSQRCKSFILGDGRLITYTLGLYESDTRRRKTFSLYLAKLLIVSEVVKRISERYTWNKKL